MQNQFTLIGYGNMGQAFLQGLLRKHVLSPAHVTVADPSREKGMAVAQSWGVKSTADNARAVTAAAIVLLAVKPQQVRDVLIEIRPVLKPDTLLISIAAGCTLSAIADALDRPKQPMVRVMPNLAATVGMSVSGWIANRWVTDEQKSMVQTILQAVGTASEVSREEWLDVVTAVSGSGPAYYYYFTEALSAAAQEMGVGKQEAEEWAVQTFLGAAELMKTSGLAPQELRSKVTSKGGTTEAAIRVLQSQQLLQVVSQAVSAAHRRAKELQTE